MQECLKFLRTLIILFFIMWIFFTFFVGMQMAPNDDMSPGIHSGDILIYSKIDKNIADNDIIALRKNGAIYFLRMIAKEGDTVNIEQDKGVTVNGNPVPSTGIIGETTNYEGYTKFPLTLKKDEYFVLADNRDGGEDSRYFGAVKKKEILGIMTVQIRRSGF